jgi:RNA-splicing ligase RtcB
MDITVIAGRGTPGPSPARPRVFDSEELPASPAILEQLEEQLHDTDLAAPPVVLPDFHHKSDMEMPSSIAVATEGTIRPTLTSSSVNCGMALIALDTDRPSDEAIASFYREVRRRYPDPPGWRRELTREESLLAGAEGGRFAAERYGMDPASLERVEEGGRLDVEAYGGAARLRKELPWISWEAARMRFGTIGPSNHFVELQVVEEIFDQAAAERLGVSEGQLTLQYHAGGGLLTGQVGRLFFRRKKMSKPLRLEMAVAKPLFHFGSARSVDELRRRFALYFRDAAPGVPVDSDEGRRLLLANAAAMNYGFAFRVATYGGLTDIARQTFGLRSASLVVDSPHNSIYEESVDGRNAIVHRHNSCRAYPADRFPAGTAFGDVGQAVLVPGLARTSSYLGVAGADSDRSLHSACHGAGTVIEQFERDGRSGPDPLGRTTLRFRYDDGAPQRVPHSDDRGVDAAMSVLRSNGLVRPVARMRPLAVLH